MTTTDETTRVATFQQLIDETLVYQLTESPSGRYYYANSGWVLHSARDCYYLHTSRNVLVDETRSAIYRIHRYGMGAGFKNRIGESLRFACEFCAWHKFSRPS